MAPVLQCPDCKTKHPLDAVGDVSSFPVFGLRAHPEGARGRTGARRGGAGACARAGRARGDARRAGRDAAARARAAEPRRAGAPQPSRHAATADATARRVPWWMRLLLWIVAVPVSFLVVFSIARMSGLFTHDQLTDVFLANGRSRFWPLARVLPFVALLTALIVQGGVVLHRPPPRPTRSAQAQGSTTAGSRDAKQPSTRTSRS